MGNQPDGADPSEWEKREDRVTRKLINRMDTMRDAMANVQTAIIEVKAVSVRWDKLIFILGTASTVIVGAAWRVTISQNEQSERRQERQLSEIRAEVKELRELKAQVRGTYQVAVEQKPRAKVAEEVRSLVEADGGTLK